MDLSPGPSLTCLSLAFLLFTAAAEAQTPGEERFFAGCPRRGRIHLHDERRPWDLHTLLYSGLGVLELEVVRVADWTIDLPLPGQHQPLQGMVQGIRSGYNRLPRWRLRRRVGEFVDALQLAELSFGDAAATYSVGPTDLAGPGSGLLIRANKLIDWTQHVTGDVNQLIGMPVGRRRGLIPGTLPERAVDRTQWLLIKLFNAASILVTRTLDYSLMTVEVAGETLVNVGHRPPHQEQTVFLRLPRAAYRAHELWLLEHEAHLVVGDRARFAQATHAALAHPRRWRDPAAGGGRRRPGSPAKRGLPDLAAGASEVIVMTTARVVSRAPRELAAYVVPAAWILNDAPH
ncbi:MAG: hypothetical protein HYT90_05345 [Candidatus Omnitrophica bacterium]|nr:hypothetical protein [Candidatus Omnitrophota bacterium]